MDASVVNKKKKFKSSKAKQYRLSHDIKVSAINKQSKIPRPIYSFGSKSCQISDLILHNLSGLGYKTPTPIQSQSIPIMMQVGLLMLLDLSPIFSFVLAIAINHLICMHYTRVFHVFVRKFVLKLYRYL